jgi:Fe-Mn family superoxide dismutase
MSFTFPELPYAYNALEPHIDAQTMEIHYTKHHQGYFSRFISTVENTELANSTFEAIFANVSNHSPVIRNFGGGYYNHIIFWNSMSPTGGGKPTGTIADKINAKWGSYENFQTEFTQAATTRFGSGFAWLITDKDGNISITSTANQDNPLMNTESAQGTPLLCLDVWEHAYYLKYQNRRPDYINAFYSVINWDFANKEYNRVTGK